MTCFIEQAAVQRGNFLLTSGRQTDVYVNAKKILMSPAGLWLAATAMKQKIQSCHPYCPPDLAGKAEGVNNLIGGLLAAYAVGQLQNGFFGPPANGSCPNAVPAGSLIIRPSKRDHGFPDELITNLDMNYPHDFVIVEDVTTTGGSVGQVAEQLRARGQKVSRCFCIVDREEGAEQYLKGFDIMLHPVLRMSDLVAAMSA